MKRALLVCVLAAACHETVLPTPKILSAVATVAPTGKPVRSIVELDGNTYVFDDAGVTVLRAGAVVTRDELAQPAAGTTIAAPGGEGRWVMSALWRIAPDGEPTQITEERLGLTAGGAWSEVAGAGTTFVARSPAGLAVATDGHHVALYPATTARELAVAPGRLALAFADRIDVWDLAAATSRSYPVAHAHVAFVAQPSPYLRQSAWLVAWTPQQLAIEGADGALRPIATPTPIAGVAASRARLWVLADGHVGYRDPNSDRVLPAAIGAARVEQIFGSPSGDVWAVAGGKLARYAVDRPATATPGSDAQWTAQAAPVFARVCAKCHLPDGTSGVDLSTAALWHAERAAIQKRVVVDETMPPYGVTMTPAERAAIAAWVSAGTATK